MKITAAVSREGDPTPHLEDVDLGEPRADEILVRIVATGICHTDLHAHDGIGLPTPKPVVLGHEGAGIVEKVGEGVFHLKPGDHVVMSGTSCGTCPSCQAARPTYCLEALPRIFGGQRSDGSSALSQRGEPLHGHFFGQSSFATYSLADAKGAVKVPRDVPLDIVAPMGCGIITGAGAVFDAFGLKTGQTIAVFGCGGVGLSAVMAARVAGATRIVAVDPVASRRELAMDLGATDSLDPEAGDVAEAIREIVSNGVDFAFVTANPPAVFDAALASLGPLGTLGFVTAPRGWQPQMYQLMAGGRKIQGILGGSANPQTAIPMMVELWRQGRFPIDRMIRHYDFADMETAWQEAREHAAIKPVLKMES